MFQIHHHSIYELEDMFMFESSVDPHLLFDSFAFCFRCLFCESNELASCDAVFGYVDCFENTGKGE